MCDFLLSRERTYMYFLNKKTKSAIHRWGFVWVYYYYKWGFGCFSAVRVHVWPSRWPVSEVFGWSILKSPFLARHCPLTSYYMYFDPWPWNACYHTWCWSRSLDLLKRSSLLTFIDNYITWAGEGDLSNHIQNEHYLVKLARVKCKK